MRSAPATVPGATRALLGGLFDHAALFPPASMAVEDALAEDARLLASAEAWMAARFVVPASRIGELGALDRALSVVADAPLPDDPRVEAVEVPPGRDVPVTAAEAYVEVPWDEAMPARLEDLARRGLRAKLRCGGAVVPTVAELAAAVAACRALGLPFKATAGLHNPVRTGGEHGFLNLLAAAVFGDEEAALADDDPSAFGLDGDAFRRRGRSAGPEQLARARRELLCSIGSCSVAEPVEHLQALGLLP